MKSQIRDHQHIKIFSENSLCEEKSFNVLAVILKLTGYRLKMIQLLVGLEFASELADMKRIIITPVT